MMSRILSILALGLTPGLVVSPALADAFGMSWGAVQGVVAPTGVDNELFWGSDWLLHTSAEVQPAGYYAEDTEWSGVGDGQVQVGPIGGPDSARVLLAEAYIASGSAAPYVNIGATDAFSDPNYPDPRGDVFAYAADPASMSDAAGFGQHDNSFYVLWTGDPGQQPASALVTFALSGAWNLAGGTLGGLSGSWWADSLAFAEVYDADGTTLDSVSEHHHLAGSGAAEASGTVSTGFALELEYDTPYYFNFWFSAESHAEVPEPGALVLLALGGALALRRRGD